MTTTSLDAWFIAFLLFASFVDALFRALRNYLVGENGWAVVSLIGGLCVGGLFLKFVAEQWS